jgi:hypothetical protein
MHLGEGRDVRHGDGRWLWPALGLISAFMVGEVVVGLVSGSLALLADAAHMLTRCRFDRVGAGGDAPGNTPVPRGLHLRSSPR